MSAPTDRQVAEWLVLLGKLVASNMTPAEASERLKAYAPLIVAGFDSRCFTMQSREFVARRCKFFPSYGELCDLLSEWRKENPARAVPSDAPAIAGPPAPHLSPEDWQWVSFWHKRRAEIFAMGYAAKRGSLEADRANLASLIRQQSPKAWAHISGVPESVKVDPSQDSKDAVTAILHPKPPGFDDDDEALFGDAA